ncbi:MAG: hypothetical protein M3237_09080 [Actinomycetota bacterium]|nr:hypothetical protein [Actinomycetota bacterium]
MLLLLLLAGVVNLPIAHGAWTDARLDRDGVDVTATVVDHGTLPPEDDPRYFVDFRYPADIDPDGRQWSVGVSETAYDEVVRTEHVEVRVLPDSPETFRVEGQQTSGLVLGLTIFADVILLAMILLTWRFGGSLGRRRPDLRMVATDDVQRCRPGSELEQVGDLWVAKGEVVERSDETVVLDLGNRRVVVELAGYANPVGYQQPARAVGRMIG